MSSGKKKTPPEFGDWEEKSPAMQFYVRDWLTKPLLRSCSRAARGVWIDALCLMHLAPVKGVLDAENRADLCSMLMGAEVELSPLIDELIRKGVASSKGPGSLISRRMMRQAKLKQSRSKAGSKGGQKTAEKMREKLQPSEVCFSKEPSKEPPKNEAKAAASSSPSYIGSTLQDTDPLVPAHSLSRAGKQNPSSEPPPAESPELLEFDASPEGTELSGGRQRLKHFQGIYLYRWELEQAQREYTEAGLSMEIFRKALISANSDLEQRADYRAKAKGLQYLTGLTLTGLARQEREKKYLKSANGKSSAASASGTASTSSAPKQFKSREEKNAEWAERKRKEREAKNGKADEHERADRGIIDVAGECILEDDAER